MNEWRNLTSEEILQLQSQRCKAEDWAQVKVCLAFSTKNISEAVFSGEIFLGLFEKTLILPGSVPVKSGIFRAHLHNCRVSDDVYINGVSQYIANYTIGEGSIIENVDCIYTEGESCFGNGTSVSVLDETGGRSVAMYEGLSSHTAYAMVMNVNRPVLTEHLKRLAMHYALSVKATTGFIGKECVIRNAGIIRNVCVHDGCEIDGASVLEEGTLCAAPSVFYKDNSEQSYVSAYAGVNVIARHFILAPGAVVKDGAQIERCFVGEAAVLSHGFSAHDSLFFANSQMENGEACASFAGPYTVSMHKATLMVGGMFSFCNFGSGTNQSNHFYKLGPMHSGVCERGCKTGSDSYLLWPGKIGPFTFIKGKHTANPDTRIFPFSYLLEDNGKSYLSPGASLRSIGTLRDELKWPQRDKRTSAVPLDKICFDVLNPQTADAIRQGLDLLDAFIADGQAMEYPYNGVTLRKSSVVKGRKLYQNALQVYMGTALTKQLERFESEGIPSENLLESLLTTPSHPVSESWTDLSGLLVPDSELMVFLASIEKGEVDSVASLEKGWGKLYKGFEVWSWHSVLQFFAKQNTKAVDELQISDFISLLESWEVAMTALYKQMLADGDLELNMMQRFSPGETKFTHLFIDSLKMTLDEIPRKAEHWKGFLMVK
jgi:Domain of unknown function (DUF4954)